MGVKVKLKKLEGAIVPSYKTDGSACMDLHCHRIMYEARSAYNVYLLKPGETSIFPTGLFVEIPEGYEMVIRPRSGLSTKGIVAELGTIDSDYRGEVGIILNNRSNEEFRITVGDRLAQIKIQEVIKFEFEEVEELSDTSRGEGGYGSTGLN